MTTNRAVAIGTICYWCSQVRCVIAVCFNFVFNMSVGSSKSLPLTLKIDFCACVRGRGLDVIMTCMQTISDDVAASTD